MGVFDDAIREHLELKRHAGADEDELKELEDEAFGPPARPGEPDFPGSTSEEAAVESEAPAEVPEPAAGAAVFDAETAVVPAVDPPVEAPAADTPEDAVIEAPATEAPLTPIGEAIVPQAADAPDEPESEEVASSDPVPAPEEPDAPDEPPTEAPESAPVDPAEASSFTTAEREAIADQPTVFFEQQPPAELELGELELDIDEEVEDVGGAMLDPLTGEEPLAVEEAFADPAAETEVAEPPHEVEPEPAPEPDPLEPEAEPPLDPEAPAPEGAEPATADEDVLEETPEFLRDNPDDDELWFEQGEPKDFDF
jgi:hypothetical protein